MFFRELFFSVWFFLPVGIANCMPIIAAAIPWLKNWSYPLDCYSHFREKRVFGDHKTIRGFVIGIISSIIVVYIQQYLWSADEINTIIKINYQDINPLVFGFLAGFGAIGGDALKSFIKRQYGIASGVSWFPFDQLDYILGAIFTTFFYIRLSFLDYIVIIFVWFFLHIIFSKIGYYTKLKSVPY